MNPLLVAIYRKDEHSLSVLLRDDSVESREANLSEALRVLVGDHVKNRGRRVGKYDDNNDVVNVLTDEDKLKFAQMLLMAGANPNTRGLCENEPLLLQAVSHGDMAMVQLLLDFVCDVDLTDERGRTCLHAAVLSPGQKAAMVGLLLACGADPNVQDATGRTALSLACSKFTGDDEDAADAFGILLIDTKANLADCQGRTALHYAIESSTNTRLLDLILSSDSTDIDAMDKACYTPLMYAIRQNKIDIIRLLIDKWCAVNIQNNCGDAALHLLAEMPSGNSLMPLLISRGADINLKNYANVTPLYAAALAMQAENVLCLLQYNADVPRSYKDSNLKPLHLVDQGHAIMAMMIVAGHDWDCSVVNYTAPRQFCFCGGPNPPDYSRILTGEIKTNYDHRVQFVEMYGSVKPLKHLCRLKIRKCIGARINNNIGLLNLPESLQKYIMLSELPQIMDTFSG